MTGQGALFDAEQEGGGSRLFDPGPASTPAPAAADETTDPALCCRGCGRELPAPKMTRKQMTTARLGMRSASDLAARTARETLAKLWLCRTCRDAGVEAPVLVEEDPGPRRTRIVAAAYQAVEQQGLIR